MAPTTLSATKVGVKLQTDEEKARWKQLACLESAPSRYPHWGTIYGLGIETSWKRLVEAGSLTHLFGVKHQSYKALTVEFLTTLHVGYKDRKVESISFRLLNKRHTLTLGQFTDLFKLHGEDDGAYTEEPEDYDRDEFWQLITLTTEEDEPARFNPSRAKINEVRNPVLRYMLKALVYLPFAHTEAGSMQSEMLFVLWGMLAERRINLGYYMIKFLERQSRKKEGKICCGGLISAIAAHLGISFEGREGDFGNRDINWDTLKTTRIIKVDKRGIGYFLQNDRKHFKFPDTQLSAVGGWTYRANWRMDTPEHLHGFLSDPPQGIARPDVGPNIVGYMPEPHIPEEVPQLQYGAEGMEEDDQPARVSEGGESSRAKRSRPRGKASMADYMKDMAESMSSLQLSMDQSREQQAIFMAQQNSHWELYHAHHQEELQWRAQQEAQWAQQQQWQAQQDARWGQQEAFMEQQRTNWDAYYANQQAEEQWRSSWSNHPPPSSD